MAKINFKIDFVVTWVDGSDPQWQAKKQQYANLTGSLNGENRYRDMGIFEYWFKNVFEFAPWVNNVFLITDQQVPAFIHKYPRVKVIDHRDFIPQSCLPTFNSNTIELNLWRIKELAEHFVLFNDDMFITQPLEPTFFFNPTGKPCLPAILNIIQPSDEYSYIPFNNMELLNRRFNKKTFIKQHWQKIFSWKYGKRNLQSLLALPYPSITGFYEGHTTFPHLKSTFETLATKIFPMSFNLQDHRRFRTRNDISHWLVKDYNILAGNFAVQTDRATHLYHLRHQEDIDQIKATISNYKIACINDDVADNQEWSAVKSALIKLFQGKYGELS